MAITMLADKTYLLTVLGIEVGRERAKKVISEFGGKSLELIAQGRENLSSLPLGDGAAPFPAAASKKKQEEGRKERVSGSLIKLKYNVTYKF